MNVIKIFTESQLILLRNINGLLGRYKLPKDMLMYMNYILQDEALGERGFIAVLLDPVMDDTGEIEDAANIYPLEAEFTEEIEHQEIEDMDCEVMRDREWYTTKLRIPETDSLIYVFYSMLRRIVYKRDIEKQ